MLVSRLFFCILDILSIFSDLFSKFGNLVRFPRTGGQFGAHIEDHPAVEMADSFILKFTPRRTGT